MSKKIYVGNLPFSSSEQQLLELFSQHGTVTSVNLITDRDTGRPRGFGFIEMESGAEIAIEKLDNYALDGRNLKVNEARARETSRSNGGQRRW